MLASDPSLSIPSAAELLRHPWFPVQPMDSKGATAPMPLGPGQTVPFGPPARPERIPTGLSPMVPRMTEMGAKKAKMGGSARADSEAGSEAGAAAKVSSMVETTDGSQALCAWLKKNTERSHLSFKPHWLEEIFDWIHYLAAWDFIQNYCMDRLHDLRGHGVKFYTTVSKYTLGTCFCSQAQVHEETRYLECTIYLMPGMFL